MQVFGLFALEVQIYHRTNLMTSLFQITLIKRIVKLCRGIAGTLSGREDERVRGQQPDIIPARPHKLVNLIGKFRSLSSSAGSPDCDDTIDTSEISCTAPQPHPAPPSSAR